MNRAGDTMRCCPCCEQTLTMRAKPKVDLDSNVLLYDNGAVRLTPSQAELLSILIERMPAVVSYEHILSGIYGFRDCPEDTVNNITTWTCHLRPLLKPAGLQIKTWRGRGLSVTWAATEKAA